VPGESPTKWQAQAYRFGVRRLESAVASGDPLLRSDPLRRRLNIAFIVSIIVAALTLGVFAVIGFVKPDPSIGTAAVVLDSDTGGAFVARNGVLYPAMNLASALLAAGRGQSGNAAPASTSVGSDTIGKAPRGPLLGIPGAPNVLSHKLIAPQWTVCDTTRSSSARPPGSKPSVTTTAIVGQARPAGGQIGADAMLVRAPGSAQTYLLFDGRRAAIDPDDQSIRLAFGLSSEDGPRPISAALLNVIPPSKRIAAPPIDGHGETVAYTRDLGVKVGEVFSLQRADQSSQVYVALSDGVERITALLGNLIRDEYSQKKQLPLVEPVQLRAAPVTRDPIDASIYPPTQPNILGVHDFSTACVARTGSSGDNTGIYAFRSVPLPENAKPVTVTKPDALTVDRVYVQPGWAGVFAALQPSQGPASGRPLYLIDDQGVAYPVVNQLALSYLGYPVSDVRGTAPELLELLPQGPTLDPDTAVRFFPQTGATASSLPSPTAAPAAPG
jgi:type VII secretion protein EccB